MTDRLGRYREMRDFSIIPEPRGREPAGRARQLRCYIRRHAATRLHYDFRLELKGVLKSWARAGCISGWTASSLPAAGFFPE